jgi:hypothetical protein
MDFAGRTLLRQDELTGNWPTSSGCSGCFAIKAHDIATDEPSPASPNRIHARICLPETTASRLSTQQQQRQLRMADDL